MRSLKITPHHGLDNILFGMDRSEVRTTAEMMGFPLAHSSGDSDYFGRSEIEVEFSDGTASFIAVNANASFVTNLNGLDVFDTAAENVFSSIAKNETDSHEYVPEEYLFPDQVVALWGADTQYDYRSEKGRPIWGQVAIGDSRYLKFCQELSRLEI